MRALRWWLVVSTLLLTSAIAFAQGGRSFHVAMTGAAEVPGPGDPDGTGTAHITINPGRLEVCWEISVSNIAAASAAHIHRAPADSAGGVVVTLSPPTNGTSSGCVQVDRVLIREIMRNPARFYVNVHNSEYPAGALRGQLK